MHKTPKWMFDEIAKRAPFCERRTTLFDHECKGRMTFEHVWTYRNKQVNELWAIIRLCEWSHGIGQYAGGLDKQINKYLSRRLLLALPPDEFNKARVAYPRLFDNWAAIIQFDKKKYGMKNV